MRKQRESFLNSDACVWWCLVSWGTIESDSGSVKSPLQAPHTKVCSHTASSHNGMQAFGCGRLADTPMDATRISQFAHVSANGQKEFQHWSVPWLLSIMPMYGAWLTEVAVPQVLWFIFFKKNVIYVNFRYPQACFFWWVAHAQVSKGILPAHWCDNREENTRRSEATQLPDGVTQETRVRSLESHKETSAEGWQSNVLQFVVCRGVDVVDDDDDDGTDNCVWLKQQSL